MPILYRVSPILSLIWTSVRKKCCLKLETLLLDFGDLTDNRKLWKTVKPVFLNEIQTTSSVTLIEDGKVITEDTKIAEIFNHYFANITESLGISEDKSLLSETNGIKDPVEKANKKYENHPSIKKIRECCELNQF